MGEERGEGEGGEVGGDVGEGEEAAVNIFIFIVFVVVLHL